MSELPQEKQVKSFHFLEETEEDVSIGLTFEDGTDTIVIIPRNELMRVYRELKEKLNLNN